ncbi:hypothetical protein BC332_26405 [Capsicum chinense]|nr:hypothetical protein BC332_26405 [Capsicum chinense]
MSDTMRGADLSGTISVTSESSKATGFDANRIAEVKAWLTSQFDAAAATIREILESVGLAQESLPSNVVSSSHVLAKVANLLDVRDTELSSFLVAVAELSLRKTAVEEKRAKVQQESKVLLEYTWKTNLAIMESKERQYLQKYGYYRDLTHGMDEGKLHGTLLDGQWKVGSHTGKKRLLLSSIV